MKHIVVPVDGSKASCHAAHFAQKLAKDTGAQLTLLYVYNAPAAVMLGFGALNQLQMDSMKDAVAQGSFDQAKGAMGEEASSAHTEVAIGHPGTEIVGYSKAKNADLIVMGSRGMSAVAELIMGSVSEYVVRHASCPVTIVR
jgi:nucleotide-binding universal stress UspA family protein